jgi:hypothetical protein
VPSLLRAHRLVALLALACAGCGGKGVSPSPSTLRISAYGGVPLEQGLVAPAPGGDWAIRFEAFRIQFSDLHIAGATVADPPRVDLTVLSNGAGLTLAEVDVEPGEYAGAAFTVSEIEALGRATRAGVTKRFAWSFTSPTFYDACGRTTSIPEGGEARFQIAAHGEALFAGELEPSASTPAFDHLASADGNGDGFITRGELELATDFPDEPGARVDNLWDWLVLLSRRVATLDGDACRVTSY